MSVILFSVNDVYKDMADAYESLKPVLQKHGICTESDADYRFYKALRRMYFANVAAYLCQYHNDVPLPERELTGIDTFQELQGEATLNADLMTEANRFQQAWGGLKYNLVTNDGEIFTASGSFAFLNKLAETLSTIVEQATPKSR